MSKPTYLGANVDVTVDSFAGLVNKTNEIRYDMGTIVVTVGPVLQPNTTNGALSSGNAHVQGYFSANTLIASDGLRGGSVSAPGLLQITSNTTFANSELVKIANNTINFLVDGATTTINSNTVINGTNASITANASISGATLAVSAVSSFTSNVSISGTTTTITSNVDVSTANVFIDASETTIGSNSTDVFDVNAVSTFQSDVTINSNTAITANLVHSGAVAQFDQNVILGSNSSDSVSVNGRIDTNIVPTSNNILDIGSTLNRWGNGHFSAVLSSSMFTGNLDSTDTITAANLDVTDTFETGAGSTVNLNGHINLGNDITDTLTVTARVDSAIIPLANTTYDLGSISNYWRNLFVANLVSADTVELTGGRLEFASALNNNRLVVESGNTSYSSLKMEFNHTGGTVNTTPLQFNRLEAIPTTDRAYSLGTLTNRFANVHVDVVTANTMSLGGALGQQVLLTGGDVRIQGNLRVDGNTSLSSNNVLSLSQGDIDTLRVFDTISISNTTVWSGNVTPTSNNVFEFGTPAKVLKAVYASDLHGNLAWSSVTSKPDPTVSVSLSGDVSGSGSATLTDLANGSISIATTIQPNSVALATDTTGSFVQQVTAGSGISVSGGTGENASVVVSHADTSTAANVAVNSSGGTVLQDITLNFDAYGHVVSRSVASVNLDGRYYTEAESDARFVNVTGDTITGNLSVGGTVYSTYFDGATGNSTFISAGETLSQFVSNVPNTGEIVHIGAEGGVKIYSSADNWATSWATSKHEATLLNTSGNSVFPGTVTATTFSGAFSGNGSNITALNGSNISTGTVADARIASTIVRTSRTINTGSGLSGGGNLSADRTLSVDSTVIRTTGNQTIGGTKTFTSVPIMSINSGEVLRLVNTSATGSPYMSFYQGGTRRAYIQYQDNGDYISLKNEVTLEELRIDGGSNGLIFVEGGTARTVYHSGNLPAYPSVGNGTITVQGTGVLGGSGAFSLNQSTSETVSISHDTMSFTEYSTNPGTNLVYSTLGFDAYGHVNAYGKTDLDGLYLRHSGNRTHYGTITFSQTSGNVIDVSGGASIKIAQNRFVYGETDFSASTVTDTTLELDLGSGSDFVVKTSTGTIDEIWHFDRSNGNFSAWGSITTLSDRRVKKNIAPIKGALNKVLALQGVTYTKTTGEDDKTEIGLIAQDIQKVVPELVTGEPDGEAMMTVNYANSVALLIEAIKEQQKQIQELKDKLNGI